jgi:hypothetical protein
MNEPMLIFECDPQVGTPKLQTLNGAAKNWKATELALLEEELRPRYESLVREGKGTIQFKGKTLYVNKKDGDTSRQPTLELRSLAFTSQQSEKPFGLPQPSSPSPDWNKGFLAAIDQLFASDGFNAILPVEMAMLKLVRDELQSLFEKKPPADSVLLVLMSILMTAEHLSRTQHPNQPHPYAYALSGIERMLSESAKPQTPWGELPAKPNSEPAPTWLGRFWQQWTGT